jgi:hypothetical protein
VHEQPQKRGPNYEALRLLGGIGNVVADLRNVYSNHVNGNHAAASVGMIGVVSNLLPGGQVGTQTVTFMGKTMLRAEALKLVEAFRPTANNLTDRLRLGVTSVMDKEQAITIGLRPDTAMNKAFEIRASAQDYRNGLLRHYMSQGDIEGATSVMLLELGHKLGVDIAHPAQAFTRLLSVFEK